MRGFTPAFAMQVVPFVRGMAKNNFSVAERAVVDRQYILGDDFTAADIMLGFAVYDLFVRTPSGLLAGCITDHASSSCSVTSLCSASDFYSDVLHKHTTLMSVTAQQ